MNLRNHYWIVGGSTTQVYSSAVGDYVPVSDPTYVAWLAASDIDRPNAPTRIDTPANLGEVLAGIMARPTAADVLDGYQDTHARNTIAAAAFKVLFNHENRLRAVERALSLNGSPPNMSANQAKAAVKALM
jgi:hypothetical protein